MSNAIGYLRYYAVTIAVDSVIERELSLVELPGNIFTSLAYYLLTCRHVYDDNNVEELGYDIAINTALQYLMKSALAGHIRGINALKKDFIRQTAYSIVDYAANSVMPIKSTCPKPPGTCPAGTAWAWGSQPTCPTWPQIGNPNLRPRT